MRFIANFLYSWVLPGMIAANCVMILAVIYHWSS